MDDVFYKDVFFSSLQKTSKIAKIEQARDGYTPQKSTSSKRLASVPPDKKPQTPQLRSSDFQSISLSDVCGVFASIFVLSTDYSKTLRGDYERSCNL
jgi:hypothetical protein